MNDDLNSERPPAPPANALAGALEELLQERSSRVEARQLDLTAEASVEEAAALESMACSTPDWQHRLAVQLAGTPFQKVRAGQSASKLAARKLPRRTSLWAGACVVALLLFAAAIVSWWNFDHNPERLLAETYAHSRIFELRMPGAGFAAITPETHLRGSATGVEPARLLDARARIESHLQSTPEDPHWLQLAARDDLLEEKFDPAIDILDRLLAAGPATASLLADDAAAYFQRGAAAGSENDRATALEYLRHADELAPGDPVILFNEAIVMEDRGQLINAVETWNRYLKFERDSRWLAEGRARLQALEEKLRQMKTHQGRMEQHLATPAAMRALAASLERNHQDPWLTQFLPADSSSIDLKFTQAAQLLAQAIGAEVFPSSR